MITQLLKFEITYQRKQWALPAAMFLFLITGLQIGGQGFAPDLINYNAPYQISYYTSVFTLGAVFAIMFFVISGVLRDPIHRVEGLIFSSGIQKHQFFISRFAGVFIFSLLAVSPLLIGMMLGTHLFDLDPDRLAPFEASPYFWNWLVFVLPNVFICSVLIFSVGLLSKNRMAIYASAILIYVFYFICSFFFESPILAGSAPAHTKNLMFAALGDPFGISAFMEQSQYLTPQQKNRVLISLTGNFLLNRILWIAISLGILGITYRLFSFRAMQGRKQKASAPDSEAGRAGGLHTSYQPLVTSAHTVRAFWNSFMSQSKMGIKQLVKNLPFQAILVFTAIVIGSEFYSTLVEGGSYSDSLYPATSILADLNNITIFLFGFLLIIFFSGEWVWKERSADMHLILDATPASNLSFFLSKVSVLLCIPLLLITLEILVAITFQLVLDYPRIDIGTYLSLYYFQGLPLFFYILFALFIQSLTPNKYLGMAITGIVAMALGTTLSASLGIEHPLLRMGAMPQVTFSDMAGVNNNASTFYLLSTHWLVFGFILSVISFHCWRRGIAENFIIHIRQIAKNWSNRQISLLGVLLLAFISTSGMIFHKTNIEEEYLTSDERLDLLAEYEKKYKHYDDEEWLYPVSIATDIALFPSERSYTVDATYQLANKSDSIVTRALFIEKKTITDIELEGATLIGRDDALGIFEYTFDSPVYPGDTVTLAFSVDGKHKGLYSGNDLVDNGSYIHLRDFSPYLGYTTSREITDKTERKKRGLPERVEEKPSDADFEVMEAGFGRVHFDAVLSVPASQRGVTVGSLKKQWTENGRNYYRYKTQFPVAPAITYQSAAYASSQEDYQGVSLEHYYHPDHHFNNHTIMTSTKQTLDYAEQEFGKYNRDHLRIAEIPAVWGFGGYAPAGTINMVENRLYLVDERDPAAFSLVAKRTIHEVAHQWWGHILSSQNISGGAIFVEGFAKYTEAVVMEKYYGMPSLFQLSESANHRYFNGRSYASTPEQPLYLEQGEAYMLYGKSYIVMYALKELIGEQQLNQVLKTLVSRHRNEVDATVSSPEFLDELYAVTPEKHHTLIDDWFKKIITYDLSVNEVDYTQRADGSYDITLTIEAKKFESVDGIESPVLMDEPVPIGLFTEHPSQASKEQIILFEARTIKDGKQQLTTQVDTLPRYVAIDPYGSRPDLIRSDNWVEVK
ncbi:MAG: hypothetical protein FH748_06065 [Balneolaceae bacterium]|nr:hypothetical protein [Balneolaceae bacterium]